MSLMSSLTDYIEDDAAWSAAFTDVLHPVLAPLDQPGPFVVFRLDEETRDYSVDGPSELRMADVQFKIQSSDYKEAHEMADMLSTILDGFRGVMGDIVVTDIRFMDSHDSEAKDEVLDLYSVICEISVWYVHA